MMGYDASGFFKRGKLENPMNLMGGFNPTALKNMSSSEWIIIPTIGENKIHVPNQQSDCY